MRIENSAGRPALIDDVSGFEVGPGELLRLAGHVYSYVGLECDPLDNGLLVILDELGEEGGKLRVPADHPDLRPGPWLFDDWDPAGTGPLIPEPVAPAMLIEERAGRPVLVDQLGAEVRPGQAVVFEGGVYFLGWVEEHLAALVRDPQSVLTETAPRLADLLVLPETLSRARSANNDRRPPADFPEFARAMESILYDIVGMAGCPPKVAQAEAGVSNLARSIETRAFHAIRLLLDHEEGVTRRAASSPPEAPAAGAG